MSRGKLVGELTDFEEKVVNLVNTLAEQIASIATDGDEFANGISIAAITLLDQSVGDSEIFGDDEELDEEEWLDDWEDGNDCFDPFEDEDENIWPSGGVN